MISVEQARERILAGLQPTPAELVALAEAWGRVTAAPVAARLTQPPVDVSAMDGYALRAADGALGTVLHVVGSAPAGHPFTGVVGPGQAVRLFTGSVVPQAADAILLQEDATASGTEVRVNEAGRAPPAARRHSRDRRRDRHAGRAHTPRRHRQFQLARARRPGARGGRPAHGAAGRRRYARHDRGHALPGTGHGHAAPPGPRVVADIVNLDSVEIGSLSPAAHRTIAPTSWRSTPT